MILKSLINWNSSSIVATWIKRINELRDNPNAVCEEVNELIYDQVKLVKIKMKELRHLKTQLEALTDSCSNNQKVGDCGIIKSLQECDC